jgi:hypothetical protein
MSFVTMESIWPEPQAVRPKERIATGANFTVHRENNAEFGGAAKVGKV